MMKKHISLILVLALWLSLTAWAWVKPADASSDSERRPLEQFPKLTVETILSGRFMKDFADYAVDQFPLRDNWRTLNAWLTYYGLAQKDNNGIYLHDGYAAKMEYPMSQTSISYAIARFNDLNKMYLKGVENIYFVAVPDKSYYMAEDAGVLSMDYEALFASLKEGMDWAQFIDITDCLTKESYYRTDTHWRQEHLLPVVEKMGQVMGLEVPTDYQIHTATDSFYGVYYGQAALPMPAEPLNWMVWEGLEDVKVQILDNGTFTTVYNEGKLSSKDPYESFLSGNVAVEVVENPNATSDRHLVVFRDSFGSSIVPLLSRSYAKITLVDTRYINPMMVGQFVDFEGAEVLFLYSTLILNSSSALRK
jgi:hypothetical protein